MISFTHVQSSAFLVGCGFATTSLSPEACCYER